MTIAALGSMLPLPVAIPLAGAAAAPLAARLWRRLPVIISVAAMAAVTAILALQAAHVFRGVMFAHFMGFWGPVGGHALGVGFAAAPLGMIYALTVSVVGAALLLYTLSELGGLGARELGGYACLFQLLLAALIGIALTADLFNLFVWFQVASLASYGLTGFFLERPVAVEAAFKILVLTSLASFAIFTGTGLLYARHGALNFGQLHGSLATGSLRAADLVALGLLVAGFATKAGLLPFHGWLADAHTAAPGPVSALFSGLMVNLGVFAIVRLAYQVYPQGKTPLLGVLMVVGVASALVGAVLALAQDDLKRLLAYDTISQMGVLAVGYATASPEGTAGATYHLVNHALFKSLLFLCAGAIVHRTGAGKLSEMGGLARRMPFTAGAFVVGVAAIAGVPGFGGYVSLSLIHKALLSSHQAVPYALMVVAQAITIAALGRAAWLAFFRPRAEPHQRLEVLRPGMVTAMAGLGAACVAAGVLPQIMLQRLMAAAAASLLHPAVYTRTALGALTRLPALHIPFDYADPAAVAETAATLIAGAVLAWRYMRITEPAPVRALRKAHTGSVNDYAAFAAAGTVIVVAVLALAG
jgi:multicomponent Na+:H+ antiporter subunit D